MNELLSCTLPLCRNFLAFVHDAVHQGHHIFARQPSYLIFAARGSVGLSLKCHLSQVVAKVLSFPREESPRLSGQVSFRFP